MEATPEVTSETVTHVPSASRPERPPDVISVPRKEARDGTSEARADVLHEARSSALAGARPKVPIDDKHKKKKGMMYIVCNA